MSNKALGQAGEDFAAKYLQRQGLKVLARNVHAQGGEIDIVAYNKREDLYVLVEVKTRTSEAFVGGLEAVGPQKQRKMQRAAAHYFLGILGRREVPEFELHAMVLTPNQTPGWRQPAFVVEYYDDLS